MDSLETLFAELQQLQRARRLPPVAQWQPAHTAAIDIRIAQDGCWFHEGRPILRQPLVDLFATILRREGDVFFLVTPAEKLAISVEDAPFIGVRLARSGAGPTQRLLLSTNVGDHVLIDAAHPLRMRPFPPRLQQQAPQRVPYVAVRDGLDARLTRSLYYELVELGYARGNRWVVRSAGIEHELGLIDAPEAPSPT